MNTKNIPLLGMGTWGMGGTFESDTKNDAACISALKTGLSLGISLIDTAEFYGAGHTEELVGEATKESLRDDIFLISKVWKTHLKYDDVISAAEGSLKRLKTDYIDLYLIHWPNEEIPLQETMSALEFLLAQGKIRAIGVSNFSVSDMTEAQRHLKHARITVNQIEYNLLRRDAEKEVIPYCKENDIHVVAYRPFAKGALTQTANGMQEELAKKYNKTVNQIALAWLISRGITAIPRSMSKEHLGENLGTLSFTLSEQDIAALSAAQTI